jgi:hypothetical protein
MPHCRARISERRQVIETFSYEIFLSYGWAGNDDPEQGARAWAALLRDRLENILGANLYRPRIYFDNSESRTGPISDRLFPAVEQSALLVFLVSPGSCRTTSWCQKEVTHFWDNARPLVNGPDVVPPEHRIFKVTQSALAGDGLVDPLERRQLSSFDLSDTIETSDGPTKLAGDMENHSSKVAHALKDLAAHLRTSLDLIGRLEQRPSSGLRVFLGPTFSPAADRRFLTLRRELLLQGHYVRSATPLAPEAETEDEHKLRIDEAMSESRLAVHLIPEPLPATRWQRNHAAWQLRKSLRKSAQDPNFAAYLWYDPDQESFDTECGRKVEQNPVVAGDQNVKDKDFGYLKENVKDRLRRPAATQAPADPHISYDVVIEHHDYDSQDAARIRDHIKQKGCRAQLANATVPGDNRARRERKNAQQFYRRAKRFVVLYGRTTGEWANDVCFAMQPHIVQGAPRPGLVVTAPPPDTPVNKAVYEAPLPEFETRNCPDGNYMAALDEWLGGPCH